MPTAINNSRFFRISIAFLLGIVMLATGRAQKPKITTAPSSEPSLMPVEPRFPARKSR